MHNKRNGQCWNQADEVDTINGHLTHIKDSLEIENWSEALGRSDKFHILIR
jgi:hypothetical protein